MTAGVEWFLFASWCSNVSSDNIHRRAAALLDGAAHPEAGSVWLGTGWGVGEARGEGGAGGWRRGGGMVGRTAETAQGLSTLFLKAF